MVSIDVMDTGDELMCQLINSILKLCESIPHFYYLSRIIILKNSFVDCDVSLHVPWDAAKSVGCACQEIK